MVTLKVTQRNVGDVAVIEAAGRITLGDGARTFHDAVHTVSVSPVKKVLLNLEGVTYIDSSGAGELVSALTLVAKQGGKLKLCNISERVSGLLKITRLTSLFEIFDDESAAIKSFE